MTEIASVCAAAEQVKDVVHNTQLEVAMCFPCAVYLIDRKDFLGAVTEVSEESLAKQRQEHGISDLYPMLMSGNYPSDPRVLDFAEFVGATAWNILNEQGYAMQDRVVTFTEMWTQEHHKQSSMEQHTHGYGSQIVGFYFLEAPEGSSHVVFHDPRIAKTMIDLPEQDQKQVTVASRMINFAPKPGLLVFANAWLAHSFTRHGADAPLKFVHFNLTVQAAQSMPVCPAPAAEVI